LPRLDCMDAALVLRWRWSSAINSYMGFPMIGGMLACGKPAMMWSCKVLIVAVVGCVCLRGWVWGLRGCFVGRTNSD
jgi:hypothetical protein